MQDQTTHERAAQPTGSARLNMNGNAKGLARPPAAESTLELYRRVANKCEAAGDIRRAKEIRDGARRLEDWEEKRVLGVDVYSAIHAARLLAAMLRSRRPLPRGASSVDAQLTLLDWLPAMRRGERAEILEILRGCSAKRLGKQLGEMVAELSAK